MEELTTLPPQQRARCEIRAQKLGKYELRREVGRGGMGVVYEAYDPTICRRVALKTLCGNVLSGPEADTYIGRLRREAQAAGRLNHPNIVAVYDFGEEPQQPGAGAGRIAYITMEFVEGRELQQLLAAQERLAVPAIVRIMGQLLDALEYSHKNGVVHRDIKPSNIMLLEDGTVKVTDFGIARIESSTLTRAGAIMGSPSYMSPEQFLGVSTDARSDLYSAGIVLYELLTGEVPFPGSFSTAMHRVLNETPTPVSALNVHAPKGIDVLLGRALAKKPADRFQSAAEFKQAMVASLVEAAGGGGGREVRGKRKAWVAIAACVVAVGVGATTYLAWNSSRGGEGARSEVLAKTVKSAAATTAAGDATGVGDAGVMAGKAGGSTNALASGNGGGGANESASGDYAGGADPLTSGNAGGSATRVSSGGASASTGGGGADAGGISAIPGNSSVGLPKEAMPQIAGRKSGTAVITAVGLADPQDARFAKGGLQVEPQLWADARRQLIEKAVALYIDPSSINAHYALLRDKLFSRSDEYISSVLEQQPPQSSHYGLLLGTIRASVRIHDVQRALNEISREQRVEFIRNNGNPRIAVDVRVQGDLADQVLEPQRSALAENVLMDRIRSFGFVAVDAATAKPAPDFLLSGEVRLKHLAATLPASGLTIEKVALTSWTLRTVDPNTGEEVYLNTTIPPRQSWASEDLALQEIGRLIGARFSREFFLQYYDFSTQRVRLRFKGLPTGVAPSLVSEATAALRILNASLSDSAGRDVLIDIDVAEGSDAARERVADALLNPLNRKLGQACFATTSGSDTELLIDFNPVCASPAVLARLDGLPPGALIDAPSSRLEEIVSDPARLHRAAL
jgi:eukaryotic-like serine/threonine-protein kinase